MEKKTKKKQVNMADVLLSCLLSAQSAMTDTKRIFHHLRLGGRRKKPEIVLVAVNQL